MGRHWWHTGLQLVSPPSLSPKFKIRHNLSFLQILPLTYFKFFRNGATLVAYWSAINIAPSIYPKFKIRKNLSFLQILSLTYFNFLEMWRHWWHTGLQLISSPSIFPLNSGFEQNLSFLQIFPLTYFKFLGTWRHWWHTGLQLVSPRSISPQI